MESEGLDKVLTPTLKNNLELVEFKESIENLSPISASRLFASLMLSPELQSNIFRLEALVHLVLAISNGTDDISGSVANNIFCELECTYYGLNEDPSEDVMITLVNHTTGSYRILEGLWEANAFHLQRIINIVDHMPNQYPFSVLKDSTLSLLKISDAIIERANLSRFSIGGGYPLSEIPAGLLSNIEDISKLTVFTWDELYDMDISIHDISFFVFNLKQRDQLLDVAIESSLLSRQPIVEVNNEYNVLLPVSIGFAIRCLVIEFCRKHNMLEQLENKIQREYISHFSHDIALLGEIRQSQFVKVEDSFGKICMAQSIIGHSHGLYFQFILIFDDFYNYSNDWAARFSANNEELAKTIEEKIVDAHKNISVLDDFRLGCTCLIGCGWGRPVSISFSNPMLENWSIASLSAYDMTVFSQLHDFTPYTFLRLLEAKDKISSYGIEFLNLNGLLNLYAHAQENNFHLVNCFDVPSGNVENPHLLSFGENNLLYLRHEVYVKKDKHVVRMPNGNNCIVSRVSGDWYFDEDQSKPLYACLSEIKDNNKLLGLVYGKKNKKWWIAPFNVEDDDRDFVFRVWDGLCHWVYALDEVMSLLSIEVGVDEIFWKWDIKSMIYPENKIDYVPSYEELVSLNVN